MTAAAGAHGSRSGVAALLAFVGRSDMADAFDVVRGDSHLSAGATTDGSHHTDDLAAGPLEPWWVPQPPSRSTEAEHRSRRSVRREWFFDVFAAQAVVDDLDAPLALREAAGKALAAGALLRRDLGPSAADLS